MKKLTGLLLIVFLTTTTAYAAETAGEQARFRSYVKPIKCAAVIQDIENSNTRQGLALMVSSFVSGSNYARMRVSSLDMKGMMLLTEQYCRKNPEAPILQALVALDNQIEHVAKTSVAEPDGG